MELKDYVISGLNDVNRMIDIALEGLTPEVAHFEPGGTTNTIAQLLTHMTISEDNIVNRFLKGGQQLGENEGWLARAGIPVGRGAFWEKGWTLQLDAFQEYRNKVNESTIDYVSNLSPEDFDKETEWFTGMRPVSEMLQVVLTHHRLGHAGEISTIKGLQGLKGLPF